MRGRLFLTSALAAILCTAPLFAQSLPSEPENTAPAHVSRVDGVATLEREGRSESSPLNVPLLSGDRLKTTDGRVEVQFADGSTLHLDTGSTIDVQSDDLVRLTDGRLRLNILGPARAVAYRIDSPAGSARITQPGEYRVALLKNREETQLELAVLRGSADLFTDLGTTPVRAGERAYASAGLAPSYAYSYNSANWDAFDRWSEERRNVRLGASSQYLPADMQSYAPLLDESGDWRQTESYGYAWYPRVAADWRPYYNGRWDSYPRYGWTWIGADRFAWPTHHYGRWGFSAGVWFWIPSSRWAPAYVSWAYAPGYVSWCPLGFNSRPIIAVDLDRVRRGSCAPWRAWTAVPYSHFGRRDDYVNHRAVNWAHVAHNHRPQFETRPAAPGFSRDVAVPRNSTPIRWAGSRSLPTQGGSQGISSSRSSLLAPAGARSATARDAAAPTPNTTSSRGLSLTPSGGRDTAAPRDSTAPSRDTLSSSRGSWLPPSGGRDTAAPRDPAPARTSAAPRYINRGDDIVRSATERPTPRAASPGDTVERPALDRTEALTRRDSAAVSRPSTPAQGAPSNVEGRGADTRTVPEGPARPAQPAVQAIPGAARAMPRGSSYPQPANSTTEGRRAYQPVDRGAPRGYDAAPRQAAPRAEPAAAAPQRSYSAPAAPVRQPGPPAYERPRSGADTPQRSPAPDRVAAPERAPERSPSRGEPRQSPPAERAAPAERPAAGSSSSGGVAVARRGGRGGV